MKKKYQAPLSWKAIRRGAVYCAPACGHGCTHEEFVRANREAAKLCLELDAKTIKGWKPRVWENLGWHFDAISACGRLKVSRVSRDLKHGSSLAFLGEGTTGGRWAEHGRTPHLAVLAVLEVARQEAKAIVELLNGFESIH